MLIFVELRRFCLSNFVENVEKGDLAGGGGGGGLPFLEEVFFCLSAW